MKTKPIALSEYAEARSVIKKTETRALSIFKMLIDFNVVTVIDEYTKKKMTHSQLKKNYMEIVLVEPEKWNGYKQSMIIISLDTGEYNKYCPCFKGLKKAEGTNYDYYLPWKYMAMDNKALKKMLAEKGFIKTLKS